MVSQLVKGYFMPRSKGIVYVYIYIFCAVVS